MRTRSLFCLVLVAGCFGGSKIGGDETDGIGGDETDGFFDDDDGDVDEVDDDEDADEDDDGGGSDDTGGGSDTGAVSDADEDGFTVAEGDCDDTRADVYPDAIEYCDEVDNDCDGEVDEECIEPEDPEGR